MNKILNLKKNTASWARDIAQQVEKHMLKGLLSKIPRSHKVVGKEPTPESPSDLHVYSVAHVCLCSVHVHTQIFKKNYMYI